MTEAVRRFLRLGTSVVPLLLSACSTEEIYPTPITVTGEWPDPTRGRLFVGMAPREEDLTEAQAAHLAEAAAGPDRRSTFHVFMDGRQLYYGPQSPLPLVAYEWANASMGCIVPGAHHFEIRVADGGPTVFAADAEILAGWDTNLYLFGPTDALQGRFVTYRDIPPAGTVRVSLTNLVRNGTSIELVTCPDVTRCASTSAPLALGETFAADIPVDLTGESFVIHDLPAGGWIGFRQLPSAQLPAPPVQRLLPSGPIGGWPYTGNWTAAPFFIYPDGATFWF